MSTYSSFVFESYSFNAANNTAVFNYSFDSTLHFTETYIFTLPKVTDYDNAMLDRAVQLLFLIAGVSYYKAFPVKNIIIQSGTVDAELAGFLSFTYQHGLREYFYHNNMPVTTSVTFPTTTTAAVPTLTRQLTPAMLVAIGGGKDSVVSYEKAKQTDLPLYTWALGHAEQLAPLVDVIGADTHVSVARVLDTQLLDGSLKAAGARNGHIPISAIFAAVSTIVCILLGVQDSVMSNEYSASEPTLYVGEEPVNHQFSKSLQFEQSYQAILQHLFGDSVRYYSLLRPLHEAYVTELFSKHYYQKYKRVFSSCNRAYVQTSHAMFWCGACPKCAFTYLALVSFLPADEILPLWNGHDVLRDPRLQPTYEKLLGISPNGKPFECVGEIKECRALMDIVKSTYPELTNIYTYESPSDFNRAAFMPHSIPDDIAQKVYPTPTKIET